MIKIKKNATTRQLPVKGLWCPSGQQRYGTDLMTNGTGDGTGRTDAPHREDRTQSIVATSEALTNQSASSYEVCVVTIVSE